MVRGVLFTANSILDGDELYPDAAVLFGHLVANRIPFGIISFQNNTKERKRFSGAGLDESAAFRIFESSRALAFEQALDRLALAPREVLIIAKKDENILEINRLNCLSAKLDRSNAPYEPTPRDGDTPFYIVRTLEEVIPLIT